MTYKIVEQKAQKCIALVKSFRNEIINEEGNHEIPDFWGECHEKNWVEPLRELRPEGKKDLYGLCSPTKDREKYFKYGIGVIVDDDTEQGKMDELLAQGYSLWDIEPHSYVVFKCYGRDGSSIDEAWKRFYREFLPQTEYKASDNTDYEIYPQCGEKDLFCELWIPVEKK